MEYKLTNKNINETTTVKGDLNEASLSTGYKINPEVEQALLEMSITVKTEGVICGQTGKVSDLPYAVNERGSFAQLEVVYTGSGGNVPAQYSFRDGNGYNFTVFSSTPENPE
ncbi:MAG: hypothetical protein ACOX2O_06865 [Bdellovibrionota bacterium]|jgi:hypothetical protein